MTAGVGPSRAPARPGRIPSGTAVVLVAAALLVAALLAVGVGGLLAEPDVGDSGLPSVEARAPVPAAPAPAPGLTGVDPLATFATPSSSLPPLPTGPFREVDGAWRVGADGAEAAPDGRADTVAVAPAPAGSTTVQVRLSAARPGAGVVASWTAPDRYVALVVDASGRNVSLLRSDGTGRPTTLLRGVIGDPGGPLVLALRRDGNRVAAIANGLVLGRRLAPDPGGTASIGMVAGAGRSADAVRFTDLVAA